MLWWTLFVLCVVLFYIKVIKPHSFYKDKNVHYDKPMVLFGNLFRVFVRRTSIGEGLEEICMRNKSHKYFGIFNFLNPILIVHDPEIIKQVGIKEFDSFLDHQPFVVEEMDPLFGKNIFSLTGQKWRNMRSTLSPAFTSSKMRSMFVLISECADKFTDYFLKTAQPGQHTTVEMKDVFTRFANDVIATCAFGLQCDSLSERDNEFYRAGIEATDFSGWNGLLLLGYNICPSLMKLLNLRLFSVELNNFFRQLVMGTISVREEKGIVRPDMIHLLMEARKGKLKYDESAMKEEDTGFATVKESDVGKEEQLKHTELTDDDLTAQALIFFFAGFDTTSILLCHMANELAVNPDIQQRLQAEVDETLDNCKGGKITYEAITKMKYMDMVTCETLRKWPPSAVTDRVCNKTFTIKTDDSSETPITMNKEDLIWFPIYAIHRDPDNFPDPERFDPERFSDENKNNIKPLTYIPFGLGPRNCIGSRFALLEAKTVFVYLLSKFDIVVDKKTQVPLKLCRNNFNMTAEKGFWVGLKPRTK